MSDPEDQDYEIGGHGLEREGDEDEEYGDYDESEVRERSGLAFVDVGFPPHQSFDVSSFTESKNGPDLMTRNIKGSFPISNAPTLEVSPEPKLNFLANPNTKKSKPQPKRGPNPAQDLTKLANLEQEVEYLTNKLQERQKRQDSFLAKIQELNNSNLQLEKVIREKDATIREKQELLLLQDKRYKEFVVQSAGKTAVTSAKSKAKVQTSYLQQFCPEFLSPEQSLELFTQLIVKIDKSTSIKKKILKDRKVIGILSQFFKTQ